MVVPIDQLLSSFKRHLASGVDERTLISTTTEMLGEELGAARVIALFHTASSHPAMEWSFNPPNPDHDKELLKLARAIQEISARRPRALSIDNVRRFAQDPLQRALLDELDFGSALTVTCRVEDVPRCTFILLRERESESWSNEDVAFVEELSRYLATRLEKLGDNEVETTATDHDSTGLSTTVSSRAGESVYRRLVENSDAIIFTTDRRNIIRFVSRRALDFFGVVPEDFVSGIAVEWFDLIHLDDRERVQQRAFKMQQSASAFEEEFRVINHITGRERWLLVKLVPVRDATGEIAGWDGFGVDITGRREAQEALDVQSKKVRALYTVSSAIRGYLDPANIAARGLRALCDATDAVAGMCYLFSSNRQHRLSLVAHHGFSASFPERAEREEEAPLLLRNVAEKGQSIVVSDILADARAQDIVDEEEGFRSAVVVPIAVEDEVFGTLALFHHEVAKFDGGDVMLIAAAANQIGLAARQANLFTAYRKQTKNLSALYRMSHELSHLLTLEEVFQQAFTIIRDELGLKRLWLGLLNESGTRIVGHAAYGPGWKRRLVEMNVDIGAADNPIQQVVQTKKAVVVQDPGAMLGQLGLRRFFSRFAIKAIGLAPLIARGQVLGVLAVQPGSGEPAMEEEEITLLSSLANEIAALILTKRLEERIAESEKMRSAGLLAAGIAHNFNNLLQAVLGQASLLEMQKKNEAQVLRAAKIISDSAARGATLVKQLLSFANLEEPHPTPTSMNDVIESEVKGWTQLLKPNQHLKLSLKSGLPRAKVDTRHVVRILTSLLTNASEAMRDKGGPIQIFTDTVSTANDASHVEVPEGTYVRIGVRDSGVGMDAETKRRCFEPFFTTKDVDPSSGLSLSGAGLGLAAAYALARKNGGRLVVDSRLGHGSVFTLYLPVDRERAPKKADTTEKRDTERDEGVIQEEGTEP